jgi:hypothetical protein
MREARVSGPFKLTFRALAQAPYIWEQSRICQNGGQRATLVPVESIFYKQVIVTARGNSPPSNSAVVAELVDALA